MDRDPHIHEIIDFLQPFIDGKVSHQCDLVRQERLNRLGPPGNTPARHWGHYWCHDNPFPCACPCHWTQDEIALKLIEIMGEYEPAPVVGTWLGSYMGRQTREGARLRSLADERDAMIARVVEALSAPAGT
ncbi:hypothetical protein [Candidatus Solirubrobacter pratensis]|uniref:hypothetical protein n=1 Tax=Candidatus Solirubrobacter pratensis TaxID=1298857 RepID=UPI00040CECCC|nr:hypothetical protein [Candidatus Solirubrobacter pratensis]